MQEVTYTVHIDPGRRRWFLGLCAGFAGFCFTQGETIEQVVAMAHEAVAGFVEALPIRQTYSD